ncbi:MAG: ABC transporter ATP-binding protein [Mariniblastus sp.]|nr:ABC transporter ATP-binding protein [Mariniblastus sp.]
MIKAQDLRKNYGENVAVDGLSFQIAAGETFGLLGPNGAGKTTTISMLVGLLAPDSGTVEVGDASPGESDPTHPKVRTLIGIAPQSLSLYEDLTAKENLRFFGQLYGLSGGHLNERVTWALEFAELNDRKNDRVKTYSGGMKRRLNIAVALIHEPRILLLDEPTVGVDPQSRNHIFESIHRLQKQGMTILYTTHYMEEAQRLCDRVAIVDQGKLLALDSVSGLIANHGGTSVVKAELMGSADPQLVESLHGGSLEGSTVRFESDRPLEQVAELTSKGMQFSTLNIAQPDLESVFLALTGRSLRDG